MRIYATSENINFLAGEETTIKTFRFGHSYITLKLRIKKKKKKKQEKKKI